MSDNYLTLNLINQLHNLQVINHSKFKLHNKGHKNLKYCSISLSVITYVGFHNSFLKNERMH